MAASVRQLKEEARRAEKREDWDRAIALYDRALRASERAGDYSLDLSLYNRIGDLHRRRGATGEAVRCYREAVDRYAEQGLYTGAIALCNKILRLAPGEVEVYRSLGRLHAKTGLVAEARNNFRQYARAMQDRGEPDAGYDAYAELARLTDDLDLLLEVADALVEEGREPVARDYLLREWEEGEGQRPELRRRLLALDAAMLGGTPAAEEAAVPPREEVPEDDDRLPADPEPEDPLPDAAPSTPDADVGPGDGGGPEAGETSEDGPAVRRAAFSFLGDDAEREDPDPAPEEPTPAEHVDLGERIRRRLASAGGAGAARPGRRPDDFDDMLVGFRAQAGETAGEAEPEAHLELGVALEQMGLLDDAIREFQAAARAPEPPLRALELLGGCFLEKGLHSVAERVLTRALRLPGRSDHDLLGVLYQLGVAYQEMDRQGEALDCYERVYSVDIDFRDVEARMEAVGPAAG